MTIDQALAQISAAEQAESVASAAYQAAFDAYYIHGDTSYAAWRAMETAKANRRRARLARTKAQQVFAARVSS